MGVTYTDPVTGEAKSLRKFYRFGVQNPLVISFKQSRWQNESLVEALIRNVSKLPLYIDSIRFLPGAPFVAEDVGQSTGDPIITGALNEQDISNAVRSLLSKATQTLVNPQEELQRVFRLSYDPATDPAVVGAQVGGDSRFLFCYVIVLTMGEYGHRGRKTSGDSMSAGRPLLVRRGRSRVSL